jgi:hypothetical protein
MQSFNFEAPMLEAAEGGSSVLLPLHDAQGSAGAATAALLTADDGDVTLIVADTQHDQAEESGFAGVVVAAAIDVQLQELVPDASSDVSSESDWSLVSD